MGLGLSEKPAKAWELVMTVLPAIMSEEGSKHQNRMSNIILFPLPLCYLYRFERD